MLKVNEIFSSIQGESTFAGLPFVFVRLTGCNLRCKYCDTKYAYEEGELYSVDEIADKVLEFNISRVCVTGGEPLLQKDTLILLDKLIEANLLVTLETNGSMSIDKVNEKVHVILDLKAPGSGEVDKNLWFNVKLLKRKDEVKFVITSRADYDWAKEVMEKFNLPGLTKVLFSPCADQIEISKLADWMVEDRLEARLNLQLHKIIWGNQRGR